MRQIRTIILSALAAVMLVAVAPREAAAQDFEEMQEQFGPFFQELGQFVADYWMPRLNSYSAHIDRSLSQADLQKLNRLRAQFAIVLEEFSAIRAEQMEEMKAYQQEMSAHSAEGAQEFTFESTEEIAVADAPDAGTYVYEGEAEVEIAIADEVEIAETEGYPEFAETNEIAVAEVEDYDADDYEYEVEAEEYDAYEHQPSEAEQRYEALGEQMETITEGSQEIAMRNMSNLAWMPGELKTDLKTFVGEALKFVDGYVTEHRSELMASSMGSEIVGAWEKEVRPEIGEGIADLEKEFDEGLSENPEEFFEDIAGFVMLFNGSDLSQLFGMVMPGMEPLAKSALEKTTMLQQNSPNPARGTTTVSYTLAEESSRTVLQIFDNRGEAVQTLDQGSRPAGSHSITVDVSKLAAGNYLYRLSVETSQGQRVESNVMQVVK